LEETDVVDEYLSDKEQWEQSLAWLRENVPWMLAGVALAVLIVGGWRWYQTRLEQQRLAAGSRYVLLLAAFSKNELSTAVTLADQLRHDYPKLGYSDQADLIVARLQVENNDEQAALDRLERVMTSTHDTQVALMARLRAARLQLEKGKPDEALATLKVEQPGAFALAYAETRGDALLAKGDKDGALKAYREAQAAKGTGVDPALLSLKINELSRS
jgi:predicted negative regulator of RcsB-dependent stress response